MMLGGAPAARADGYGLGRPAGPEDIAPIDLDVRHDGLGLPPGSGSYARGLALYAARCAQCHGAHLEGRPGVGGSPLLGTGKTVQRYWPYAPPLFGYVRRSMPLNAPESLTNDEVYSVVAFILAEAGIFAKTRRLDAAALSAVKMPNRAGFVPDDRPDVAGAAVGRAGGPSRAPHR